MAEAARPGEQGLTLPYGPTKGMMQALQLMRKSTPSKIDGNYLRMNKVAPGNEYKVIGALRFLGIIDDEGKPTEKSQLLKTKGVAFTAALQEIVKNAYKDFFQQFEGTKCAHEDIYNHFITVNCLGPEMAAKTTRFFVQLCHMAEIDLGIYSRDRTSAVARKGSGTNRKTKAEQVMQVQGTGNGIPLILALTPEMAAMDTEELAQFFMKLKKALARASEED